jgi:GNAT superfamily N-acetyltransferase
MNFILDESPSEKIKEQLHQGIRDYNRPHLGEYHLHFFSLYKNDDQNNLIAGIYGFILSPHQVLRLEYVWVDEAHRGKGLGTSLLQQAEDYATQHHCKRIQIRTFSFQAPEFYQKLGYRQIGSAPQWFCDQDELYFEKIL